MPTKTRTEARMMPLPRAHSSFFWDAPSSVLTTKQPTIEQMMPMAAMTMGSAAAFMASCGSPGARMVMAATPRAALARIEPQYDS